MDNPEVEFLTPTPHEQGKATTMDFPDAIREVINGKKITRMSWTSGDFCLLRDGWLTIYTKSDKDVKQEFHTWSVNDGDLEGNDWVVIGAVQ